MPPNNKNCWASFKLRLARVKPPGPKALAQQSLNAGLQAAQQSTALLLEEAARMNAAEVRKALEEGVARMEQALAAGRRIAWLSLAASVVALIAAICAIFGRVIHWLKTLLEPER
jgi:hypothetical protein